MQSNFSSSCFVLKMRTMLLNCIDTSVAADQHAKVKSSKSWKKNYSFSMGSLHDIYQAELNFWLEHSTLWKNIPLQSQVKLYLLTFMDITTYCCYILCIMPLRIQTIEEFSGFNTTDIYNSLLQKIKLIIVGRQEFIYCIHCKYIRCKNYTF